MKTDLKESFLKKIEETNELFNKSTKAQKRVMIAQDCIDRINIRLLGARRGSIIRLNDNDRINKEILNNNHCEVCAKGGLFVSYVGRVNNLDIFNLVSNEPDNRVHKKLFEIFSLKQLATIEFAFEGFQYLLIKIDKPKELRDFYLLYENENERLIAICENIIANKGTFKV